MQDLKVHLCDMDANIYKYNWYILMSRALGRIIVDGRDHVGLQGPQANYGVPH